jgi:FtsZ-binding cell division protein ZapB
MIQLIKENQMANNIFGSSYSTSNPFSMNTANSSQIDTSLQEAYAKLEALKKQQIQGQTQQVNPQSNVYVDISNEFKNLTEDEQRFVMASDDYQKINLKYQQEFSEFLTQKFALEYLQTGNTRTLEEMLYIIRKQKDKYKEKFAEDINEIRTQNKSLLERNNQLAEANVGLQEQLKKILGKIEK